MRLEGVTGCGDLQLDTAVWRGASRRQRLPIRNSWRNLDSMRCAFTCGMGMPILYVARKFSTRSSKGAPCDKNLSDIHCEDDENLSH